MDVLVEFRLENYRSFCDMQELSMRLAPFKDRSEEEKNRNSVLSGYQDLRLLSSAAVYGPNASGKSNLLKAFSFMKFLILSSLTRENRAYLDTVPFLFKEGQDAQPAFMEVVFVWDGVRYRYGFEADREKIHREWLFLATSSRESAVFFRDAASGVKLGRLARGFSGLEERTAPHVLFLSVAASFNAEIAKNVWDFWRKIYFSMPHNVIWTLNEAASYARDDEEARLFAKNLLRVADFAIDDISVETEPLPVEADDSPLERNLLYAHHAKYGLQGERHDVVKLNFKDESYGTRKFLALSRMVFNVFSSGGILVVDELDASFHPAMQEQIIQLFHSEANTKGAQLIFSTHNASLLKSTLFRRDQVWFTQKRACGETELYSLAALKVPKGKPYDKEYLMGKYGAVPYLEDFSVMEAFLEEKNEREK